MRASTTPRNQFITIDFTPDVFDYLEDVRRDFGYSSRNATIRAIIRQHMTTPTPVREDHTNCPDCCKGNHCGGNWEMMTPDPFAGERGGKPVKVHWTCSCPICAAKKAATEASATLTGNAE